MTDDEYARRDVLNKVVGLFTAGGAVLAAEEGREYLQGGNNQGSAGAGAASEEEGFNPGQLNTWDSVEKCLSTDQEESVTEVVERYESLSRNDLRYSIETDGNVIIHEPAEDGYRPIAETTDNDFMCEIDY